MESHPLSEQDIDRLGEIRADYLSDKCARVVRTGQDTEVTFALQIDDLTEPFRSQGLSIVRQSDQEEIKHRMSGQALQLVAEKNGRLVALLDAEVESWRRVLKVWNLLVDEEHLRQGIGTELMQRARQFAAQNRCRAISVEAQATNWPALCFYMKMGFEVCGVDDHFYTNRDLERKEVALYLYRELP